MPTPITTQPFILSEDIREEDYMTIATIGHESFLPDRQNNLKIFNLPPQPITDEDVRRWLSSPAAHVIKAVSTSTNEIMGSICWVHRGYLPRPPQPETTHGDVTSKAADAPKTKIQELEILTGGHFREFMTDIMPYGTKCWFIGGLNVKPKYQGMGVGRALMEWGLSRAEKDKVFAWVHSSDPAWKAYRACGFEVVRELRLVLDEYAEGEAVGKGPGKEGEWGIYTFRYMVYRPERAVGLVGK